MLGIQSPRRWIVSSIAALSIAGLALGPSSPALGDEVRSVLMPAGTEKNDANTHLIFPWDCSTSTSSLRQQQIYRGTDIGVGEIVELRFRQDAELGLAFGPVTLNDVTIRLSSTDREIDQLSLVFADNLSADARIVFAGDLTLSSAVSTASPRPFDIGVVFQNPFPFFGSETNHLLLDVTLPACGDTTAFDAVLADDDEVARVWETDATATIATRTDTVGLVTEIFVQAIFDDGFETGDMTEWTLSVP